MRAVDETGHPGPLAVGVPAAAVMLGVSESHLYNTIKRGEIPVVLVGRRKLIPIVVIRRLLDEATCQMHGRRTKIPQERQSE